MKGLISILMSRVGKGVFEFFFPYPFDFVLFVRYLGHVMYFVTRVDTILTGSMFLANSRVYNHAPAPRRKPLFRGLYSVSLNLPFREDPDRCRGPKPG